MKLLAKTLIVFMSWGTLNSVIAADPTLSAKVTIKELGESKVQLIYTGDENENIVVQIYDNRDRKIFGETIRNRRGFKKPYNLSQLPYGRYTMQVEVDDETMKHTINHTAPAFPGNVKVSLKATDDNQYRLLVMGPSTKDFTLRIYDDHDRLILSEPIKSEGNFGKVYTFKGTRSKTAHFVIADKIQVVHTKKVEL